MKLQMLLTLAAIAGLAINADMASSQILQGKSVLFVGGGDPDPTNGDDTFVFDHLEDLGADVTYLFGDASTTADGRSVREAARLGAGVEMCFTASANAEPPVNGGFPVSIAYRMAPRA